MKLTDPLVREPSSEDWTRSVRYLAAAALGAGAGAGLMYWLDPDRGKARRAQVESQIRGTARAFEDRVAKRIEDADNRLKGALAGARRYVACDEEISNEVLTQRVRASLGHATRHAHAITVESRNGRVILAGQVLGTEATAILAAAESVPGVKDVESRLELHDSLESPMETR
jgi:hypothetical protein